MQQHDTQIQFCIDTVGVAVGLLYQIDAAILNQKAVRLTVQVAGSEGCSVEGLPQQIIIEPDVLAHSLAVAPAVQPDQLVDAELGVEVLALILPGAVNVWNIILARTYFKSIPHDLYEAAMLDGASDIQYFFKVLLPVCKPIIMVLFLYQFVGMWNGYFDAMIYLEDQSLQPLQLVIRSILVQNTPRPGMVSDAQNAAMMAKIAEQLKYSTIVISSLPLLAMYPFFQKYFEKGVMMGSVKG